MYTVASYVWLYIGKKKGLIPLESSLFVLKLGIFCHVLGWRQLNSDPKTMILNINLYNIEILYPIFTQIRFSVLNPKINFVQCQL